MLFAGLVMVPAHKKMSLGTGLRIRRASRSASQNAGYVPSEFSPSWWLRSPLTGNADRFVNANTNGSYNNNNANNSNGVAFGIFLGLVLIV